jgi:hypothetical protein
MNNEHDSAILGRDDFGRIHGVAASVRQQFPGRSTRAAQSAARARLAVAAKRAHRHNAITNEAYYGGPGSPVEEESIHEITCGAPLDAVLTRNHYGCLVLNAAHALFIDVDVFTPSPCEPNDAVLDSACRSELWRKTLDDLRIVLADEKNDGFRIYRTAAGYRILTTANEFEPRSGAAQRLMEAAGADAAFVKLCRIQKSFRARLTPKPWRCGSRRPPNFFPRESADEQRRFADWLSQYERACRNHATCRYLGQIGRTRVHKRIVPIVKLHDRETKALEALPLA